MKKMKAEVHQRMQILNPWFLLVGMKWRILRDLRILHCYCWGFKSSGEWHHVVGWLTPDISKGCHAFILDCLTLKMRARKPYKIVANDSLNDAVSHSRWLESSDGGLLGQLPQSLMIIWRKRWILKLCLDWVTCISTCVGTNHTT
jgi:hypothetical protein